MSHRALGPQWSAADKKNVSHSAHYGFLRGDDDNEGSKRETRAVRRMAGGSVGYKKLDVNTPLHTTQGKVSPDTIARYKKNPVSKTDGLPVVMLDSGKIHVLNGHHRIAAARQAGRKTIKVITINANRVTQSEDAAMRKVAKKRGQAYPERAGGVN